jgi:hypothetical protein
MSMIVDRSKLRRCAPDGFENSTTGSEPSRLTAYTREPSAEPLLEVDNALTREVRLMPTSSRDGVAHLSQLTATTSFSPSMKRCTASG